MDHPEKHTGYSVVTRVVREKEVWKNKEDAHGGPGYYPDWEVIVESTKNITVGNLPYVVRKVAQKEGLL